MISEIIYSCLSNSVFKSIDTELTMITGPSIEHPLGTKSDMLLLLY